MLPVRVLNPLVESGRKLWWYVFGAVSRDMTILRKGGVLLEGGESEKRASGSRKVEWGVALATEEGMPKKWP